MYERFTDRAWKTMQLANQEAQRFNHNYVGTEHVLLGLVKEGSGVAATVLAKFEVDLRKVRLEVEKIVQSGPDVVAMGKLPQTPRAQKTIEYAMKEARNLNHNYVGTEHLLLGLLREEEGVAAQVLRSFGLELANVRQEVIATLNAYQGNVYASYSPFQNFFQCASPPCIECGVEQTDVFCESTKAALGFSMMTRACDVSIEIIETTPPDENNPFLDKFLKTT